MRDKLKKIKLRHIGMLCAFAFLFGLIGFTAVTAVDIVTTYADDESSDAPSFADMSKAAAEYLSFSTQPSNNGGKVEKLPQGDDTITSWTNVGGLVGYISQDSELGKWLSSWLTNASSKAGYSTYKSILDSSGSTNDSVFLYVQYGAALNAMGFDSTGTEGGGKVARSAGGWILFALYTLSGFVPALFGIVIDILQTLNPFQIFSVSGMQNILAPTSAVTGGVMYNIGVGMADFYSLLAEYGWTICAPLFLAGLLLEIYLFKKTKPSSAVKKFVIRLCAIGLGIPLLGATYTEILNMVDMSMNTGNSASTLVVTSILVDFENWVENCRLDWVDDSHNLYVKYGNGSVDLESTSIYNQRSICYNINKAVNSDLGLTENIGSSYNMSSALDWNSNLYSNSTSASTTAFTACQALIKRYAQADTYTAADWESRVKAATKDENIELEMKASDTKEEIDSYCGADSTKMFTAGSITKSDVDTLKSDSSVANIWGNGKINGTLRYDGVSNSYYRYSSSGNSCGDGYDVEHVGGLSTMSMYNYLNTAFGSNSLILYSTKESTSLFTREQHYSVNLIGGDGFLSIAYWFNAVTLLLSFTVIGFVYAFGMIFYIISRSIRMLTAIPGMLLGSVKAFGKVIVYTICMILQVIVTMIMYEIVTLLLYEVNGIVTIPISQAVTTTATVMFGDVPAAAGIGLLGGLLILGSVIQLIFVFFAIKERRVILKGFNEAAEQIINHLLDTNSGVDNSSTLAQKAAGAAGGIVGAAAATKLAGGGKSSNKNAESGDSLEDTKNPDDESAGTGGGDETPDATGSGGSDSDGTGSGGIEGEDAAMKAEQKQLAGEDQKQLEDKEKKDAEASSDKNEDGSSDESESSADNSDVAEGDEAASDSDDSDGTASESDDSSEPSGPATDEDIAAEAASADSLESMSSTKDASAGDTAGNKGSENGHSSAYNEQKAALAQQNAEAQQRLNEAKAKQAEREAKKAGRSGSSKNGTKPTATGEKTGKDSSEGATGTTSGKSEKASQGSASTQKSVAASTDKAPSAAQNMARMMAAQQMGSAVAKALGADDASAQQAGQMAAMGAMAAQQQRGAASSSDTGAPRSTGTQGGRPVSGGPSGGKTVAGAGSTSGSAPTSAPSGSGAAAPAVGGKSVAPAGASTPAPAAPAAGPVTGGVAPSAAMPSGAVVNASGQQSNVVQGSVQSYVANGGVTNAVNNDSGTGAPMTAKVDSTPGGSSGNVFADSLSASEAAELAQMARQNAALEREYQQTVRSRFAVGRAMNTVQNAPGNIKNGAIAGGKAVVGGVKTGAQLTVAGGKAVVGGVQSAGKAVVNTAVDAKDSVVNGARSAKKGLDDYGKSGKSAKEMKRQAKELSSFAKSERQRSKRIERASGKRDGGIIE